MRRWNPNQLILLAVLAFLAILFISIIGHAQVPVTLSPVAKQQFFDASGKPLAGGALYTFQAGTTTPQAAYTESSGTIPYTNPIILDAGGFVAGGLFISGNGYKFTLCAANTGVLGSGVCGAGGFGPQQWVIDNILPPPFLAGNNAWTGNETHAGIETFNAAIILNGGGAMSGAFTGNPTFSGNPQFSGTLTANIITVTGSLNVDTINGTLTNGGSMVVTGAQGAAATNGEGIAINGGAGGIGISNGGAVTRRGGAGGTISGPGGDVADLPGNATSGNSNGGRYAFQGGTAAGTGNGGGFSVIGGSGGNTAGTGGPIDFTAGPGGAGGNGADITLTPGTKGAGGIDGGVVIKKGHIAFNSTAVPTCSTTGFGAAPVCTVDTFSGDSDGFLSVTAGAGALALGTLTLTFNKGMGANGGECMWELNDSGTGTWDVLATVRSSVARATANSVMKWNNNAVALTNGSIYNFNYHCIGAQ